MPHVHIVTDSTADLPAGLLERENLAITFVPLNVHFGDETLRDKVDITNKAFFQRLTTTAIMPTTSQPAVGDFEAVYRKVTAGGDAVCSIHIASHLSGTYQSAVLAARGIASAGAAVQVIDSLNVSLGLGLLVLAAARLARDGADLQTIVRHVEWMIPRIHLYFTLDTLEYLQRGGRIGRAEALLGALLNVKPILRLEAGQVVPVRRERTRPRALQALVALASGLGPVETLGVIHSDALDEATSFASRLAQAVSPPRAPEHVLISELGPVIGTHTGPGTLGFVALTCNE